MKKTENKSKWGIFIVSLVFCCALLAPCFGQTFKWAKQFAADPGSGLYGTAVGTDALGNIYMVGQLYGSADMDPGVDTFILSTASPYWNNLTLTKLDAAGNFLWARNLAGSTAGGVNSIAVDGHGNSYVSGYFIGTVDFDPGPGTYTVDSYQINNSSFILKLDSTGNFVWVRFVGHFSQAGNNVSLDGSGNIYNLVDNAIFKLNNSGDIIWQKRFEFADTNINAGGYVVGQSMHVSPGGDVFIGGRFAYQKTDFDPGPDTFALTPGYGFQDLFIVKLNPTGDFSWAKQLDTKIWSYSIFISSFAEDEAGNIYIGGNFVSDTFDIDPGPGTNYLVRQSNLDNFILKLNANGQFLSAHQYPGDYSPYSIGVVPRLAMTSEGELLIARGLYLLGEFGDLRSKTIVSKVNSSGNLVWEREFGSETDSGEVWTGALHLDDSDNFYLTGLFIGTHNFHPNGCTLNLSSDFQYSGFLIKLNDSPSEGNAFSIITDITPEYPFPSQEKHTVYLNYGGSAQSEVINVSIENGASPYVYEWFISGCNNLNMTSLSNSQPSYTFVPSSSSICRSDSDNVYTFSINVSDAYGCSTSATARINVVDPYYGNKIRVCHFPPDNQSNVQLISISANAIPTHLAHGDYLGNCYEFESRIASGLSSPLSEQKRLQVYPNPSDGYFTVELPPVGEDAILTVTDPTGRVIRRDRLNGTTNQTMQLDLKAASSGLYILEVKAGSRAMRAMISKE